MRNYQLAVLALVLALAASACGTTRVVTNVPNARIYVDGVEVASNELRMRGAPGTTTIEVVAPDGRRMLKQVRRSFTGFTFMAGLFTYGVGFFAAWELPGAVMFYFDESQPVASWDNRPGSAAGATGGDAWQTPPSGHTSPDQIPRPSDDVWQVSAWPRARSRAPSRAPSGVVRPGFKDKVMMTADMAAEQAARKQACPTWRAHWKAADAAGRAALEAGKPKHCETSTRTAHNF